MDGMIRSYCKVHDVPTFSLFNAAFDSGVQTSDIMADAAVCFSKTGYIYTGFRHFPHFDIDLEGAPCLLLVRDPRDMLVSMYYSVLKSHVVPKKHSKFLLNRREAAKLSVDEFVLKKAENYLHNFERYRQKLPVENLTVYRYEDVIYDKAEWLRDMVGKLGLPQSPNRIRKIARDFDVFPGAERQEKHIRQVHPGNHKKKLKEETIDGLNNILSEFLNSYGYLDDDRTSSRVIEKSPPRPRGKLVNFVLPGCAKLEQHYAPRKLPEKTVRTDIDDLPRISIVVPSYNQGGYIEQTLESIIGQGYSNLELIVVDGGSNDGTVKIIERYGPHIKWWVSEPDDGQTHAINKGMAQATGDILAWLNSDDCLMPGALSRVAEVFQKSADTEVVYGHRVLINDAGEDVGRWVMPGHRKFILSYADFIPQETMFWRADLWQKVGGKLDETFHFAMDWELIQRFVHADAKFTLIPAFLGKFRMHEAQKTNASIETDGFREMEIIRQRCRERFSSHPALQNLYYLLQRASFFSFVLRARVTELLWQTKLKRID